MHHARKSAPERAEATGSPLWYACSRLGAWEKLVRQMAGDWAPSGWYPADLYRDRVACRGKPAEPGVQLHPALRARLSDALTELDALFTAHTVEDPGALRPEPDNGVPAHGWWWDHRPDPLPW
ncbi:hypothetical protein AB0L59_18090 [Streptomyces sp. NPDC052109]|uniref:hypothetical protein n=1 Tax=Streptomyces sp. NPDC052109 TaxID=3155527 RepID=UPI00343867A6